MTNETSYLKGRHLIYPLALASSLFFLWGFSYGLLDVLNKHFQNVLQISKLESTALQIAYFGGGYFCFSPIAAEILRRKGFKVSIVLGLMLFALGAISFWPAVHFAHRERGRTALIGFTICTWIIACGLATLETSANSFVTLIGNPKFASMRLQFCQSWNGVGSFLGPLIASNIFFSPHASNDLNNVRYVYIAVSCVAVLVAFLFLAAKMPEIPEEEEQRSAVGWKRFDLILPFFTIFAYVGVQVTNDSFFINYATENADFTDSKASNLLSYALIIFTLGRFIGALFVRFIPPAFLLLLYSILGFGLSIIIIFYQGRSAVYLFMSIYFFESVMFPLIFVLGLGQITTMSRHRAAGTLIMGISGGAVFPPIQGALADRYGIRSSFLVPSLGFLVVIAFALNASIKTLIDRRRQSRENQAKLAEGEEFLPRTTNQ